MEVKSFRIQVLEHRETELLLAISPDHKGLYVHARDLDELEERIPVALQELLEAEGIAVLSVKAVPESEPIANFRPLGFIANAELQAA